MKLEAPTLWALVHGLVLGGLLFVSFVAGVIALIDYRFDHLSPEGLRYKYQRLLRVVWCAAFLCWFTVISGTYIIYPFYRMVPMQGTEERNSPRSYLLGNKDTSGWHEFGMEWKEHIGWLSPMVATAVAVVVTSYKSRLSRDEKLRNALLVLYLLAFLSALVAGILGTIISRLAPV